MKFPISFPKKFYWLGPFAAIYAWVAIGIAAYLNPWWNISQQALSYMGSPSSSVPWVYNYVAMVPTGILIAIFSIYLFSISRNLAQTIGSAFFLLAGVLVILIGVFHQTPGKLEIYHEIFSAWFFLQAFLTGLAWGIGLRREGRKPVGNGMLALVLGAVLIALLFLGTLGYVEYISDNKWGIPGGIGEALGILATDFFIVLMYFAKDPEPYEFNSELQQSRLSSGEIVRIHSRPSLVQALQIRAITYVSLGLFFFFFGYYYLQNRLVSVLINASSKQVIPILGIHATHAEKVVVITLAAFIIGYFFLALGAARWRRSLPHWPFRIVLWATVVTPLIMVATWFYAYGNVVMLVYLAVVALFIPLGISLFLWFRTRYAVTDLRAMVSPGPSSQPSASLPVKDISAVALKQSFIKRREGVGDIIFLSRELPGSSLPNGTGEDLRWRGVCDPKSLIERVKGELHVDEVRPPRARIRVGWFLASFAIVTSVLLLATLVPVFAVTDTVNLPCFINTTNTQAILNDPWPYVENVTLPPGEVSFHWYSGSPVWFMILGLLDVNDSKGATIAIAYNNTAIGSLVPGHYDNLTATGHGSFASLGGSSILVCGATSIGVTVTLTLKYSAPLIWE